MVNATPRYLRLIGRLLPDNRLLLLPAFSTDRPPRPRPEPDGPLVVELLDGRGEPLLRRRLSLGALANLGPDRDQSGVLLVKGRVPILTATRRLRFRHDGIVIHEVTISEHAPLVRLVWRPTPVVSGQQEVSWEASHGAGLPLQYILRYSHDDGATWLRASWRSRETRETVDFDQLPGGERCHVALEASDGINTATATSDPFAVAVKPVQALLLEPADGTIFRPGEPVWLRGQGYDLEARQPDLETLIWSSSLDGELGRGAVLQVPALSPGEHLITLTAGTGARLGRAERRVLVANAPTPAPGLAPADEPGRTSRRAG